MTRALSLRRAARGPGAGDDHASPDAATWARISEVYDKLGRSLRGLLGSEDLSPGLQAELLRRIDAAAQATQHARQRAATLKAGLASGGA